MIQDKNVDIKNAKTTEKSAKNIKKIIKIKNKTRDNIEKRNKKEQKRIINCNKKILKPKDLEKSILLKINEFNTNGKKTIVYFIDSFYPVIDGVVSVLDNYANFMSDFYNVVICSPKHKNKTYEAENYLVIGANSVYLKNSYDMGFPDFDDKFNRYISLLKIDLIHINAPFTMGHFGLVLAKKRKIPSISTFHSQFKQDFYKATNSKFLSQLFSSFIINIYQKTTITLTMNQFSASVMEDYGLKNKKVGIVPNATSLKYKEFDEEYEKQVLSKYNFHKEKFNLIFIGRLVKVKNVYFILDVLKEFKKVNPEFQMMFLGYGPEEEEMKNFCKENGLEDNVLITGKVSDENEKSILIKNSDILFFPSNYDTDGIVRIECACFGVPTLCAENTGVSSSLIDNETGFVEKLDIESMVNRLVFLSKNVDFVKIIGKNAKENVYITWQQVGEQLKEIYEELLNTKNIKKILKNNKIKK